LFEKYCVGEVVDDGEMIADVYVYTVVDYQVALSVLPLSLLVVMIVAFFLKDKHTTIG
jgi:hypothetical protein